ncbi:MAG: HD domain-containing phosphohydrolase [Planctomycetota bacterium]
MPEESSQDFINQLLLSVQHCSLQGCLHSICENVVALLRAEECTIFLLDPGSDEVYVGASLRKGRVEFDGYRFRAGEGVAGWVAREVQPLVVENLRTDARVEEEWRRLGAVLHDGSLIGMPLVAFDRCIGVMEVTANGGRRLGTADLPLLQPLANIAALAIPKETDESFARLAEVCVRFLEEKDRYTHGHSIRVMRYSMIIADELALPKQQKEEVRLCSLLHDIGKVVIRESVLCKEGQLTKAEMQTIKMHPSIGFNIIEKVSKNLSRKILSHHERFDGKGYPEGLKGEEIPLISRIIAVGDTLDAVTTDRPYRKARGLEFALSEIVRNSGTQFDPSLVHALVGAYRNGTLSLFKA